MKKTTILLLILLAVGIKSYPVYAQTMVKSIVDGDTIWVSENNINRKIRFYCIDTPETKFGDQVFGDVHIGKLASEHLSTKLKLYDVIELKCNGTVTYNRDVCEVYKNGHNINKEMVADGFASIDMKYCKYDAESYQIALKTAKDNQNGLWSLGEWQKPSDFRKQRRQQ